MAVAEIAYRQQLLFNLWSQRNTRYRDWVLPESYKRPLLLSSDKPRIFALLIGIDRYDTLQRLRGAANDVVAVNDYLLHHLRVEPERIVTLVNTGATRSRIIEEVQRLKENSKIDRDDPILIYFAGYGGDVAYAKNVAQFIVPQDYSEIADHRVPAIPLWTIAALLKDVARTKGNNITVVLDCSYSMSGTQPFNENKPDYIRAVPLQRGIHPITLDNNKYDHGGFSDYMLLKACTMHEPARETFARGNFTKALIQLLRMRSPHEVRYSDITSLIDQIPGQTPRVEGPFGSRTLFDGKALVTHRNCFHATASSGEVTLHAGTINGITPFAEFALYASTDTSFKRPLAALSAQSVGPFSTFLSHHINIEGPASGNSFFAIQTKTGRREDVRFYFSGDDLLRPCYEAVLLLMQNGDKTVQSVSIVDDPKDAHIEIAIEDEKAIFLIHDENVRQYGITRFCYDLDPTVENMLAVLKSAADYYWKINRTNQEPEISDNVSVEFYMLRQNEESFNYSWNTLGPNMCKNGVVELVVDADSHCYGIRLVNNSAYDLYPYLFYFSSTDLGVVAFHPRPDGIYDTLEEAPLKGNGGTHTVGYGDIGGIPLGFALQDNQDIDIGFIKIFLSTTPVDLSAMPQSTPFEGSRSGKTDGRPPIKTWSTILFPIVQLRYPRKAGIANCPACDHFSPNIPVHNATCLESENYALNKELTSTQERGEFEVKQLQTRIDILVNSNADTSFSKLKMKMSENFALRTVASLLGRGIRWARGRFM